MTVKLEDFPAMVTKALADLDVQNTYVQQLVNRIQAGEVTMLVYDDSANVWTEVKVAEFWKIQYDKWLAMSGYAGDLHGLLVNLQTALDGALASVVPVNDRVIAAQAAEQGA